jgi:hypothetical protein
MAKIIARNFNVYEEFMNRIQNYFPVLIFIFALYVIPAAQDNPVSLSWNGYLQTDNRLHIGSKDYHFTWQEYRLDLKSEVKIEDKAHFFSEIWLRSLGFANPKDLSQLQMVGNVSPLDIQLREAYVSLYNIPFTNFDCTIGRQRIAWGSGDRINPIDNINPYDMEDIWEFGRHLASDGLKLNYYRGDFSISGVVIPFFRPAVLPQGDWMNALMPSLAGTNPYANIVSQTDTAILPGLSPSNATNAGFRIKGKLFDWDISASYLYGRDCLPILSTLNVTLVNQTESAFLADLQDGTIDMTVKTEMKYPRFQVAGFDVAGSIWDIGTWAEVAVFFPEKVVMPAPVPQGIPQFSIQTLTNPAVMIPLAAMLSGIHDSLVLDDKPYVKFVIGADYTFPANIYVNLQYVHGFVHERGSDIEDYLMGNLDWKLLNDKLKLTPVGVGLEIKDFNHLADSYAFVAQPAVTWYPVDNAELSLGARIITGKEGTYFGKVRNDDEVFLRCRYSF